MFLYFPWFFEQRVLSVQTSSEIKKLKQIFALPKKNTQEAEMSPKRTQKVKNL
jgi:hypothetical protein